MSWWLYRIYRQGSKTQFNGSTIQLKQNVPAKHKFPLKQLNAGDPVLMYGVLVGKAVTPIQEGEPITVKNLQL